MVLHAWRSRRDIGSKPGAGTVIYASLTPETTTRLRPHICVRMRAYVSGMKQIGHESTESTWEVVGGDWTPLGHVQGNCKGSCVFL